MRVFALELNNDLKGIEQRKAYIEDLIGKLPSPELVVLPELSLSGYMASQALWEYADDRGRDAAAWAVQTARRFQTCIGVGYVDREDGDYYNRYLLAGPDGVYGIVTKSEGESAVFRRGSFGSLIDTPFGRVGVAICYDSRRRHFYENVKSEALTMILFPHGAPADPNKPEKERKENDLRCMLYADAYHVPVVYVNSVGALEPMPGKMGEMMRKRGFRLNGLSRIYDPDAIALDAGIPEAVGAEVKIHSKRRVKEIVFYGEDVLPGNRLFKQFVLKPDTKAGIRLYEQGRAAAAKNAQVQPE